MYKRFILQQIEEALADTPVVFINGPRQAGKSTLVQLLAAASPGARYHTLDDLTALQVAREDPIGFVSGGEDLMIIDEVQRAPDLFLPIKAEVDRNRRPGRFLLTGSANVLLLPNICESLAGRMEILTLYPLACSEISGEPFDLIAHLFREDLLEGLPETQCNRKIAAERIAIGGFPDVQGRTPKRRDSWMKGYQTALLQRDVRDLMMIEDLQRLPNLMKLIATRTGSLLNIDDLSRSSGVPATTLRRYFLILETLFLVQRLPAWSNHRGRRLVKSPRVYVSDSGMHCHLLGLHADNLGDHWGMALESFCLQELTKLLSLSEQRAQLYHYRTARGEEVDFVLEAPNGSVAGIEIKGSATLGRSDFAGLRHLRSQLGDQFTSGSVFYLGNEAYPFGDRLWAIPIGSAFGL